tara:strand:+ start:593 stop:739 length:147 start_codon:yes stop_codon:yes gene_type:complete
MSLGEFNGGDEATWGKVIIFFIIIGLSFLLIWLFGPETDVPINPTEEN